MIELAIVTLGPQDKRRLELRQMGNEELFQLYDTKLVLRLHNAKDLSDTKKMLVTFNAYLDGRSPTPGLAKSFLAQYANRKPKTLFCYLSCRESGNRKCRSLSWQ